MLPPIDYSRLYDEEVLHFAVAQLTQMTARSIGEFLAQYLRPEDLDAVVGTLMDRHVGPYAGAFYDLHNRARVQRVRRERERDQPSAPSQDSSGTP